MGYGKKLRDYLKSKGLSISTVSAGAGIPVSVFIASIDEDKALSYEHALPISKYCGIPMEDICEDIPKKEKADESGHRFEKLLDQYYPILNFYAIESELFKEQGLMLLEGFYALTDQGRCEVLKYLKYVSKEHLDHFREHVFTGFPKEKEETEEKEGENG